MFTFEYKNIDFAHKLDNPSSPVEEYYKHIHQFYELFYFVRGNVRYTVETETRQLNKGDLVFIPARKYHFATVDLSVPYERYVLKMPASFVPDYLADKLSNRSPFYAHSARYDAMFKQLDVYIEQFSKDEVYTLFSCEAVKLLVMLCHERAEQSAKHSEFIDRVLEYINANLKTHISTQLLANELHYSKSYINTEFKKQMKIPVMQYVRSKKIMAAQEMILDGARKSEVAELFGFENYSTFYRAYKQLIDAPDNYYN